MEIVFDIDAAFVLAEIGRRSGQKKRAGIAASYTQTASRQRTLVLLDAASLATWN
jgi:hypothetical protein